MDEALENGNGKQTSPGSKWEIYAREMVLWKYPDHEIRYQTPTIRIDTTAGGVMRPDLAVYKEQKLIAVVEVGDLSRPDKLDLLKHTLPGVAVWWIPKTDLLSIVMPSIDEFRLAKYAREEIGSALLNELFRERQEIIELRKALTQGMQFMRRFAGAVKALRGGFYDISDHLDSVVENLKEWEAAVGHIEFKEGGIPDHEALLNDLTQK